MIQWTPALSVGIDELDGEHKAFFILLNHLYDAMKQARGQDEVVHLMVLIEILATRHFEHESQEMERFGYPDMAPHLAAHEAARRAIAEAKAKVETGRLKATVGFSQDLTKWLVDHVMGCRCETGSLAEAAVRSNLEVRSNREVRGRGHVQDEQQTAFELADAGEDVTPDAAKCVGRG